MALKPFMARSLVLISLLILPAGSRLQPQTEQIQVSQNQAVMDFPSLITFNLRVSAGAPIQLVSLRYGTSGRTCEPGVLHRNLIFTPASSLALSWSWHLREEGLYLPPGAQVWWQWLIHTSDEQSLLTEIQTLTIQDLDHDWQSLERENILLEWQAGDSEFGQTLMEIAVQSQERLASEAGLYAPEQIHLLVYPDADAVHSATLHLPEWTGGVAYPEYHTALVAVTPTQTSWARLVIPHEIAHLISAARIFNCHGARLPLWMVEGFSKFAEGSMGESQEAALLAGLSRAELPDLVNLADRFPHEAGPASQAYLVSLAAVNYLLEIGGTQVFSRLLDQVQAGANFDQAMLDIYGYRTETLDQAWRAELGYGELPERLPLTNKPAPDSISGLVGTPGPDFPLLPAIRWDQNLAALVLGLIGLTAGLAMVWRWAGQKKK